MLTLMFPSMALQAAPTAGIDGDDYTITAEDNINLTVDFSDPAADGVGAVLITGSDSASDIILNVDGATNMTGDLTVGGNTSLATIGTSGLATLNAASVSTTFGVTGNSSLATLSTSGLATLNSASVNTTLGVTGNSTLATLSTSGLATLNAASVSTTLEVTGATTLQGATTVNNTLAVDSNGAAAGGNTLTVDATSSRISSGSNTLTVDATNGTTIDGNLTVNGTITTFNPIANSGISNGNNSVLISGANNQVTITADDNATTADGRGNFSLSNSEATLTVTNSSGNSHGLTVTETQTELTGGSQSTSMVLDDNGATFSDSNTSAPVKVTGIADGTDSFDAANIRQLNGVATTAYAGIASVAALAAIPAPVPGKRYSLGVGLGHYAGEEALAVGFKSNLGNNMRFSTAIGRSHGHTTTNMGLGFSW